MVDPGIAPHEAWLSFEGLPLKWHYPLGLLYDLFSGAEPAGLDRSLGLSDEEMDIQGGQTEVQDKLPWKLTLHYSSFPAELIFPIDGEGNVLRDAFVNAVKEADFLRNGTAVAAMSLSKQDASNLWRAVLEHDMLLFNSVNTKLLNPPGQSLRHVPIKVYLPITSPTDAQEPIPEEKENEEGEQQHQIPQAGSMRVVQGRVPPLTTKQPTTLGTALNSLLPTVFPSRRNPVLACPVLHGAVVPMAASLEELGRACSYADGFLHIMVKLLA